MTPMLGIMASQISGHLWAPEGAYDSLANVTLSATTASVTFAGIPADYKHLQIRVLARLTAATTRDAILCRLNSDTASNYYSHWIAGSGSAASSNESGSVTSMYTGDITGASSGASMFGVSVVDILDYSNSNKYKVTRTLTGHDQNGSGYVWLQSGLWRNTAAVSTITLLSGSNFATYSSFALYGVK
jgi:hypothetical protein